MRQSEKVICHCYEAKKTQNFCGKKIPVVATLLGLPYEVFCTEPKGHEGPHIACASGRRRDHQLANWENVPYDIIIKNPIGLNDLARQLLRESKRLQKKRGSISVVHYT